MKLRAYKGTCSSSLENCCACIGCLLLVLLVVAGMLTPALLATRTFQCTFTIAIVMSILLLVASIFRIRWLLLTWCIYALLMLFGVPYGVDSIACFYRALYARVVYSRFLCFTMEYLCFSALYIYFIRMVLSYYADIRDLQRQQDEFKANEESESGS